MNENHELCEEVSRKHLISQKNKKHKYKIKGMLILIVLLHHHTLLREY